MCLGVGHWNRPCRRHLRCSLPRPACDCCRCSSDGRWAGGPCWRHSSGTRQDRRRHYRRADERIWPNSSRWWPVPDARPPPTDRAGRAGCRTRCTRWSDRATAATSACRIRSLVVTIHTALSLFNYQFNLWIGTFFFVQNCLKFWFLVLDFMGQHLLKL